MANTTPLSAPPSAEANNPKNPSAEQLILDLRDPNLREDALISLSKKRERFEDLALLLWNSSCTITVLLQEIISIYRYLYPPILSASDSNRVCNALALFQCVASDPRTKTSFLNASILLYFYPFLLTTSKARPFEYLRLTTLGVIGALVKLDDSEVVRFLLQTQVVPLCLHSMEIGSELSKTVSTFIVQKLLLDDLGLQYICTTAQRFVAVCQILSSMVTPLAEQPSTRLLKHIIRCYLRLSEHPRASIILNNYLPDMLKDGTIDERLRDDPGTRKCLHLLLHNVSAAVRANQQGRI
ncbi:cell differentiation protein rcd1-like isoform X1 [Typha angustifolia]|uniref:cell differentiation protein rcd1-like isoform X1 n=1 Tax=Typha angustifolia TaxID=59011 RepID=UPI003C30793F